MVVRSDGLTNGLRVLGSAACAIAMLLAIFLLALTAGHLGLTLGGAIAAVLTTATSLRANNRIAASIALGFCAAITLTLLSFDVTAWRASSLPPLALGVVIAGIAVTQLMLGGRAGRRLMAYGVGVLILVATLIADEALFRAPF